MTRRTAIPYLPVRPIKYVPQRRDDDCGIACTAMLAGVSYAEARASIVDRRALTLLTDSFEMRRGLATHGIRLGSEVRCADWGRLLPIGRPLLLAVNYVECRNSDWHWMAFDPSRPETPVHDPRDKAAKSIDRRTRLFSYFLLWRETVGV